MINIELIAKESGTHKHCIESWINLLEVTESEIDIAMSHFDKRQRFKLIFNKLKPAHYLKQHSELLDHVQEIPVDIIKALPQETYEAHLKALTVTDLAIDKANQRFFPYNSYNAQVFCGLRHLTKKSDIKFIKRMYTRSIRHYSYVAARQKLSSLTQPFITVPNRSL